MGIGMIDDRYFQKIERYDMIDILKQYAVFLLEFVTIVAVIGAVIVVASKNKKDDNGEVELNDLTDTFKEQTKQLETFFMDDDAIKKFEKEEKQKEKQDKKHKEEKPRVFVLEFEGDVYASEADALREEVTAILTLAKPEDEVLLKLESSGGTVVDYGFAASQLQRLRDKQIPLTVTIDKIAASGGYMMACVANKIIAAPFAVVGSIGVVAEVPNIHRFLKNRDIDVDVMTAGQYKRTVTFAGENTQAGKEKFQQELDETHALFKNFVSVHRPQLDIDTVATGEHWYGNQAIALNLIDGLGTSDDIILELIKDKQVIEVAYEEKKTMSQKLSERVTVSVEKLIRSLLHTRSHKL